ncbi:hypothetical protein D3C87_2089930 [compost metagenome]
MYGLLTDCNEYSRGITSSMARPENISMWALMPIRSASRPKSGWQNIKPTRAAVMMKLTASGLKPAEITRNFCI